MSQITAGVILVTLATGLIVPNAQDTGFLLLCLLGLWWLAGSGGWRRPGLSRAETAFVIVSLALVLAWWAAWWLHGLPDAGERSAQRVPKLLGAIVVLLLVRRCRNLAPAWWHGLTIGAWGAGIYALWYVLSGQVGHYEGRVEGPTNPIYFGGLSLAFCLMLLPRIADPEQPPHIRGLAAGGAGLALLANALSGSRGAWIAIPVMLLVYVPTIGRRYRPAWRLGVPVGVGALCLLVLLTPLLPTQERLADTVQELHQIGQGVQADGAIGRRIQMWQIAVSLIAERPWLGVGPQAFRDALEAGVASGRYSPFLLDYTHPHNAFLSTMLMLGIPGLVLQILLMFTPIMTAWSRLRSESLQQRQLAWCALAVATVMASMALSESVFERSAGVVWFSLLIGLTLGLSARPGDQDGGSG